MSGDKQNKLLVSKNEKVEKNFFRLKNLVSVTKWFFSIKKFRMFIGVWIKRIYVVQSWTVQCHWYSLTFVNSFLAKWQFDEWTNKSFSNSHKGWDRFVEIYYSINCIQCLFFKRCASISSISRPNKNKNPWSIWSLKKQKIVLIGR